MYLIIIICVFILLWALEVLPSPAQIIGRSGEKRVARKLNWLSKKYITLNDLLLPTHYGTTQVDHIVVSPYGIFVIETKNYKGYIFGHENAEEWKQSLFGEKSFWSWANKQYRLINPIRQNATHAKAVKAILKMEGNFPIIPIVVFSDNAKLKITAPNHIVINWSNLRSTIKSFKTPLISQEEIPIIVTKLSSSNITTKGSRKKHIQQIETYRKNRESAISKGKCPKCGGNLVEREGEYGKFMGCSNFPKCRFSIKHKAY